MHPDSQRTPRRPRVRRWYACYTRGRHEKRVHEILLARGYEVYLPLVPRLRQWHDREKIIHFPLFPSYIFLRARQNELYRALGTPGLVTVVRINGAPAPIRDEEIESIRRATAALMDGEQDAAAEPLVEEGYPVRVVVGSLKGVEGTVLERRGGGRVLLQVGIRTIGQGLKVEVDEDLVEVLEQPPAHVRTGAHL